MIDPADQRASDEAIKRNTNLTPTGVRQALQETASDFQRRVDAQSSTTPVDSIPKQVGQITTAQTNLIGAPINLTDQNDNQNAFPKNSLASGGITADIVVCVDNGDGSFTQKTASFINGLLTKLA